MESDDPTPRGLSSAEATAALAEHGRNELTRTRGPSALALLAGQFKGAMIWLLIAAAIVSVAVGERTDAAAIAVILVLNAFIGFFQEYRAERAVEALRGMTAPHARVDRDGRVVDVPAAEVVPGDLLVLRAGDIVAADARIVDADALAAGEAALTGESLPVDKRVGAEHPEAPLAERRGSVFMGTSIAGGSGRAIVRATGMRTELGRIAHLIAAVRPEATPLQRRLESVGRLLMVLCLGLVGVVALVGFLRGLGGVELLLSSISLAVAAVPEGLAAIVTIALALGVQRMIGRHVLVRRLPAVETLGSTTVICTDKTGTLTTGTMSVREVWGRDRRRILEVATACSDAELDGEGGGIGTPTELAILRAAAELGISREAIERERPRERVHPFDPDRKRMSIRRADGVLYVKGAIDRLLPLCSGGTEGAEAANDEMAARGLRILGVAVGASDEEEGLELLGLVGLADPPRSEAIAAVAAARRASIRTVMITGDHPITARAIAREMGILRADDDPDEIVHARATPEDKLRIVRSLKERGEIVAMTGDGVNDAPALREAHIGVAMGKGGTEVTREAADMVLTDDNFASIIAAVREGRAIFDNIRKALVYLLAGNVGELLIVLIASIAGLPLPLTALMLLWINLVTDGLPALALVMDPPDPDAMERPPRSPAEPLLGRSQWWMIGWTGVVTAATSLGVFVWALHERDLATARNLAFSTLVFSEVLRAFAARSPRRLFFEVGVFSNIALLVVVSVTVLMQIGVHHIPALQQLFGIEDLTAGECVLSLALGLVPVTLIELAKVATRLRDRARVRRSSEGPHFTTGLATLVFLTLVGGSTPAGAAEDEPLRLSEFVGEVAANNPTIAAGSLRGEAARLRIRPAGALPDPFFAVGVDQIALGRTEQDGASVWTRPVLRYQVNQTIPVGRKRRDRRAAAASSAATIEASVEVTRRTLRVAAIQLFVRALYLQDAIDTNTKLIEAVDDAIASAEARYATGGGAHHDVLLALAERAVLRRDHLVLERALAAILAQMNELRGVPAANAVPRLVDDGEVGAVKAPSYDAAITRQPELQVADAAVAAADARIRVARSAGAPDVSVQLMAMQSLTPMMPSGLGGMIGLSAPIYWRRKQGPAIDAAQVERRATEADREALRRRLEAEWVAAERAYKTSVDTVTLYEREILPAIRAALESSRSSYVTKNVALAELLRVIRVSLAAELEYAASQVDVRLARLRMEELLSRPSVVRIAPGAPTLFGGEMGMPAMAPAMGSTGAEMPTRPIQMGPGMQPPATLDVGTSPMIGPMSGRMQ